MAKVTSIICDMCNKKITKAEKSAVVIFRQGSEQKKIDCCEVCAEVVSRVLAEGAHAEAECAEK